MANRTVKVRLDGDASSYIASAEAAEQATERLHRQAERFDGKRFKATIDLRYSGVNPKTLADIERQASRMNGKRYDTDVHVGRSGASDADLAGLGNQVRGLPDNKRVQVDVRTDPSSRRIGALVSGIAAVAPAATGAAAIATGAIGGLTTVLGASVVGAGTAALAFAGIGDAVKAMNDYALDPSSANLKKMEEAMRGLTGAGRTFAQTVSGLRPELDRLRATAQNGLLPGATEGIKAATAALPALNGMVARTSEALGQLAREGGASLGSPFWRDYFDYMGREAPGLLLNLGRSLGNTTKGFAGLSMGFTPVARDMMRGLEDMSKRFADWSTTLDTNRGFQDFIDYVRQNGPLLMSTLGSVSEAIVAVVNASLPIAPVVLTAIKGLAEGITAIANSGAGPVLIGLASALGTLNLALKLISAVKGTALVSAIAGLGAASRNATPGVVGLGNAADKTAGKTRLASGAMAAMGGATGLLGAGVLGAVAGFGVYQSQIDDTSRSLLAGGLEAENARTKLLDHGKAAQYGGVALYNYGDALTEAEQKARDAYNAMTPLERAQVDVTRSQNDLNLAIGRFGPGSQQAIDASRRLGEAQANQAVQTQLANRVGMDYYRTLSQMAQQAGPAGDAARRLASGLSFAEISAMGATVRIDGTGAAIARLPNGKEIRLNADGRNAEVGIQAVSASLDKVPVGKTVNVGAITSAAQNALRRIGIEVQTLPNGTVNVTARDAQARSTLIALGNFASQLQANPAIKANPAEFNRILDECLRAANIANGTAQINGDPAKFNAQRDAAIASVQAANPIMPIHATNQPAKLSIEEVQRLGRMSQTFPLNTNAAPANGTIAGTQGLAKTPQTMPHLANSAPARGDIRDTQSLAVQRQTFPHLANTAPAAGSVRGVHGQARETQTFRSEADTGGASSALSTLYNSWMGRAIRWVVNVVGGRADGGPIGEFADGGSINAYQPRVLHAATGAHVRKSPTRHGGSGRMTGPGSGTSDSIPLMGSNGEWMIKARTVAQQGAGAMAALNAGLADIVPKGADHPFRVAMPHGVKTGDHVTRETTVNNYVEVNNPRAERSSDDIQRTMRKLANHGMFSDG